MIAVPSTRRRGSAQSGHQALCSCAECTRLDLAFPGEGFQLALPLNASALDGLRQNSGGG